MKTILAIIGVGVLSYLIINPPTEPQQSKAQRMGILAEKAPKRDQPGEAAAWMNQRLETADANQSPAQLNQQFSQALLQQEASQRGVPTTLPDFNFEELGPGVFGGRVRAFTTLPSDSNVLLTGGVSGGVWKSTNGGQKWRVINDFLPTLAVSTLVRDPNNENTVYMGTGEGFFNIDAQRGAGIFKSTDFGESWAQMPSTNNADFHYVNRMAKLDGQNVLLAATRTGIHRSTNDGTSWTEVSGHTVAGRGFVDLKVNPTNTNHVLAVHYGNPNGVPSEVVVNGGPIAGTYNAALAQFGTQSFAVTADIVLVDDGTGTATDACEAITNNVTGAVALIDRGSCNFTVKVQNAENAGAIAVIVANDRAGAPINMGGTDPGIGIGSVMISQADGATIKAELLNATVNATVGQTGNPTLDRFITESTDGGQNWATLDATDGLPDNNVGRIEVAFGADGVIYAAVANEADATRGLWRSPGQGSAFVKTASTTAFIERQGWYDLVVAVDPSNSDKVIMGAVDQFITTNAGATISKNTFWNPGAGQIPDYVHADQHIYYFDPNDSNTIYVGSDGGIFRSTDGGSSYENINSNFYVSQSYGIAVKPDGKMVTSGTQDNGSQLYFGDDDVWLEWSGGDGGYSAWDQQDGNYVYGSRPRGSMFGSNNSGFTDVAFSLPDTTGAAFIQPFTIDPNNGNRMLVGTDNLFFSSNIRSLGSASFVDVSGTIGQVSATTISSVDGTVAFGGTTGGTLIRVDNLGTSNDVTDISAGLQVGSDITDVYVDPADGTGNTLIVSQADYGPNRLSRSTNNGASWTSASGNLPNIPLLAVTSDPLVPGRFFVGSELGLFVTEDITAPSPDWGRYDFGPAFTRIIDLVWNNDNLYIGTHGRGTYKASRDLVAVELNDVQVTNMACDNDEVLDVGETANVLLNFTNLGGMDITGAVANVSANGVTITTPMVNLGTISTSVTQAFEMTLDSSNACPGTLMVDVTVTHDAGSTTSSVSMPVQSNLVVTSPDFNDGGEFIAYMTSELVLGAEGWERTGSQANNGFGSWFSTDEAAFSDKSLLSPWLTSTGNNVLNFAMFYNMEGNATQFWDGVVLELRTRGGDWTDIGVLSTVPYDGLLFTNNTAPARLAWSGNQSSWRNATVDLGSAYNGDEIQFRFRMVTDVTDAAQGFWVDDIQMTNVEWVSEIQCEVCVSDLIFEDGFE